MESRSKYDTITWPRARGALASGRGALETRRRTGRHRAPRRAPRGRGAAAPAGRARGAGAGPRSSRLENTNKSRQTEYERHDEQDGKIYLGRARDAAPHGRTGGSFVPHIVRVPFVRSAALRRGQCGARGAGATPTHGTQGPDRRRARARSLARRELGGQPARRRQTRDRTLPRRSSRAGAGVDLAPTHTMDAVRATATTDVRRDHNTRLRATSESHAWHIDPCATVPASCHARRGHGAGCSKVSSCPHCA
jgi:hypothetical protein